MKGSAVLSECGNYRYSLERFWDENKPMVMFVMLNPSTADAMKDDATVRRCIGFAKNWGFGSLCIGNLFAFRSRYPTDLLICEDPIGEFNKEELFKMYIKSEAVVCAWGNSNIMKKMNKRVNGYKPLKGFTNLNYIDLSIDGTPKHPLYLKSDSIYKKYTL